MKQETMKLNMLSANLANMVPSPGVGPAAAAGFPGLQSAAAGLPGLQGAAANAPGANLNGDILKSLMGQLGRNNGQNQPQ
mmetsp:Transcript_145919/g.354289  ORF Transcript_145919/g.354289 Transcript_145919/m.354289 type:complete len:80 (+) Transcript_145919:2-241(+)